MLPTLCAMDGAAEPPGMDLRRVGGMDPIGRLSLKVLKIQRGNPQVTSDKQITAC